MDAPIQLENFRLEPDKWASDMYLFQLVKGMTKLLIVLAVWAGAMSFLLPDQMPYFAGGVIGVVVVILVVRWTKLQQMTRDPFNRALWVHRQMEFDDSEIRLAASDGSRSQVPIKNFVSVSEFHGYYILNLSRSYFWAVPQSAFKSESDEQAFRQVLYRYNLVKSLDKK